MLAYQYTFTNNANGKSFSIGLNDDGTSFCANGRGLGLQQYPAFELDIRNEERDKSGQHGIWDFYSFYGKRNITFEGKIMANSHADLVTFQNKVREVLSLPSQPTTSDNGYITLSWTDALGVGWQVDVKIQQDLQFRRDMGQLTIGSFYFSLKASNSYILSSTEYTVTQRHGWRDSIMTVPMSSPTTLQIEYFHRLNAYQIGTAPSPGTYTMYGPLTNPSITKLSETFSNSTLISDFESTDGWTGDMTTDTDNFQSNDEALKLASTGSQAKMNLTGSWDLSDPQYVNFFFYVDEADNIDFELFNFTTNMVGQWLFNEESGTTALDTTDYGNDGTIWGPTYTSSGREGYGLTFAGGTDFVDLPSGDLPTEQITVSVWVKMDSYATDSIIVRNDYGTNGGWVIYADTFGNWVWGILDGTATQQLVTIAHGSDTTNWVHLVGTYDGATQRFYKDSVEAAFTNAFAVALLSGTGDFHVGHDAFSAPNCTIDALHVFSVAATDAEVISLYDNPASDTVGQSYIRFIQSQGAKEYVAPFWYGNETIQDGWNYFSLLREEFEQVGSPTWASITEVELSIKAKSGTTLTVTFDDLYVRDVTWTETKLEITGTIAADDYFVFDTIDGTIVDSAGADQSSLLTTDSEWFYVDPRQNLFILESDADPVTTFLDPYQFEANLVGYWPMQEGSGTQAQEISGTTDHITINGATHWLTNGVQNYCLGLAGASTSYLEATSPLGIASGSMVAATIAMRYKFNDFSVNHSLFFRLFGDAAYPKLYYVTATDTLTLAFAIDGIAYSIDVTTMSTTYDETAFLDIVCVFDCNNTGTFIYINGTEAGSDTTLGSTYDSDTANTVLFGKDTDLSYYGAGMVDEIVMFDDTIDSTEIAQFSKYRSTDAIYQEQFAIAFRHAQL